MDAIEVGAKSADRRHARDRPKPYLTGMATGGEGAAHHNAGSARRVRLHRPGRLCRAVARARTLRAAPECSNEQQATAAGSPTTATGCCPSTVTCATCRCEVMCSPPPRSPSCRVITMPRRRGQIEAGRFSMIDTDAPHHTRRRKIIARGFTPRVVERLRADLTERARTIVRDAVSSGSGDFVRQVSSELPPQAIASLLGVPLEDRCSSTGPTR